MTQKMKKETIEIPILGKIKYEGIEYIVREFNDDNPHVEPCGECCFGKKVSIGLFPHIIKGETKMVNECGWKCNKPNADIFHCTAVNRKDKKNVFFQKQKGENHGHNL